MRRDIRVAKPEIRKGAEVVIGENFSGREMSSARAISSPEPKTETTISARAGGGKIYSFRHRKILSGYLGYLQLR